MPTLVCSMSRCLTPYGTSSSPVACQPSGCKRSTVALICIGLPRSRQLLPSFLPGHVSLVRSDIYAGQKGHRYLLEAIALSYTGRAAARRRDCG